MLEQMLNPSSYTYNPHAIPVTVSGILIFTIGLFIFLQTKRTIKNISFFLFCMSSSLWLTTMGFVYSANDPQTALILYKAFTFFGVINLMPNLYLFSVVSSGLLHNQRFFVILIYVFSYSIYTLSLITDKFITTPTEYFWGLYPHYESWNYFFLFAFLTVYIACQVNLRVAYKREQIPIRKTQITMIIVGLLLAITAFADFIAKVWTVSVYPFGFISMTALTCIIAYSIVKYKAFNIETVIHKTILWILSFCIVTVPLAVLYMWYFPIAKDSLSLQIIYGIACFIVVTVYMRQYQPKIDHFFQRRKANLEEISSRFVENLVYLKGLDNLIRYIEETIDATMYPNWIDIFILNEEEGKFFLVNKKKMENRITEFKQNNEFLQWLSDNNHIVHSEFVEVDPEYMDIKDTANNYFTTTEATVAIPLIANEQLLGMINLSRKTNLKRYNALDFQFLSTLKNQAAIAISNSLIYQNIEEQVKKRTAELVDVQKQLTQAEKLATVGTLSGGVAHEINNPLSAILTSVQMLLAISEQDEEAKIDRESLELIEEATQRCRVIVQKLMTYAKKPLETEEVSKIDLLDVLNKVIEFLGYQLEQEDIKIVTKIDKGKYPVMGNQNELEQVVTNIILNARDSMVHAKKKGKIHLNLSKDKKLFKIEIKDEGGGIPKSVIPKIFDPFFTTKDVGKGLGLGLSICQSIIDKHNGRIYVDSTIGQGSVFTIELSQYNQVMEPCNISS